MALITCRECGRQISDQAQGCPGCGCPIIIQAGPTGPLPIPASHVIPPRMQPNPNFPIQQPVVIEQTGKPIKLLQLIFGLLAIIFIVLAFAHHPAWLLPASMSIVGMIVMKIVRWWSHG